MILGEIWWVWRAYTSLGQKSVGPGEQTMNTKWFSVELKYRIVVWDKNLSRCADTLQSSLI
jgi:hypothetical protein